MSLIDHINSCTKYNPQDVVVIIGILIIAIILLLMIIALYALIAARLVINM